MIRKTFLLFAFLAVFIYILTMLFKDKWLESLTINFVRIIFCLDAIFLVSFSFGLIGISVKISKFFPRLVQWILYIFAVYIVFFQFQDISIDETLNMNIGSEPFFSGEVQKFFPWDWVFVYNTLYKMLVPGTAFLFLMVFEERKGTQLQKYQSLVIFEGVVLMWALTYFFKFLGTVNPSFTSLYMYAYLAMYVLIVMALQKKSVPSRRAYVATLFKNLISYIVPGAGIGLAVMFIQPAGNYYTPNFIMLFVVVSIIAVLFALFISDMMSNNSRLYSADYGHALERQLATIDYAGEMLKMGKFARKGIGYFSLN